MRIGDEMTKATLVVCARGVETPAARAALAAVVHGVRRGARGLEVVDAFVGPQQPDVADVVAQIPGRRLIVPLTLWHDDEVVARLRHLSTALPGITVTAPIGPDWLLAELGVRRLIEAGARPDDSIVLAAGPAGSARAVRDIGAAARLLSAVWGGRVHVAVDAGGPALAEAIDIARAYQRRVVVSMYELTMSQAASGIGRLGADVVTAPLLSAGNGEAGVVSLVHARATARGSWVPVGSDPSRGA